MKKIFLLIGVFIACVSCSQHPNELKVAATPVPHAELLRQVVPELKDRGVHLRLIEVDDYNTPNRLLLDKQIDANFFQHRPFLEWQNEQFGDDLIVLAEIHIEPLGVYSDKLSSIKELPHGATVAIAQDPTNEARALHLLQEMGLITLDEKAGALATTLDIAKNPKNLHIQEIDASLLPRVLPDVSLAVIPANFALQAGLNPEKDALALEGKESLYPNVIVIRKEDLSKKQLLILKELMTSEKMRVHIKEKYAGALVPAY